ncbi:YoaK family protein, partial [Streptomyces sp. 12297]
MSLPLSVSALLDRLAARLFPAHENQQGRRGRHGILPPLLVVLTFVTGLVDAVSYLGLDRVFVANMTGNVVFVGFALAGDTRLSATASLLAVSAFFAGALAGGRFAAPRIKDPMVMFAALVGGHAVLVAAALGAGLGGAAAYPVIALLAVGMGLQNAVVQRLAVPDLTTTVLTRTLTGLAADPSGPAALRRAVSI